MRWGQLRRLKGWAKAGLAISPLLPAILGSLYFSRDLHWSAGYPVRIPWDQIPVILPDPRPGATWPGQSLTLALPILVEEEAIDASLESEADANLAASAGSAVNASKDANGLQARSALPGIMPLSFDLVANPEADGILEVRKPVSFSQQSLGTLTVRIDDASRIYVSRVDMARQFPESLRPPRSWEDEYVLLSQVRAAGIDLRYDPTADQFVLRDDTAN